MRKLSFSLALVFLAAGPVQALELKNVRPTHGQFGSVRSTNKLLPGDYIYMMYDIEDLQVDPKTRKASFLTEVALVDASKKVLFKKDTPMEMFLPLGGNRAPGELNLVIGPKQPAGNYEVRLRVTDRLAKKSKDYVYTFELTESKFGIIGVIAPAFGVPGTQPAVQFALVNMPRDKSGMPNIEVTMKVLDETGKALTDPVVQILPRDLDPNVDLKKEDFAPMGFPIYLNRPGRFIIAIDALDKIQNRRANLQVPLTVLDLSKIGGK